MKIRTSDHPLLISRLRESGHVLARVVEVRYGRSSRTTYVYECPEKNSRATVYHTSNGWFEITYSQIQ